MVEEGIRPELYIKVGTNQQGTNMISNNSVSAFYRAILMRRISSSMMDLVLMLFKDVDNITIRIKFAALVHKDILCFQIRAMDV